MGNTNNHSRGRVRYLLAGTKRILLAFLVLGIAPISGQCQTATIYVYSDPTGTPLAEANSLGQIVHTYEYSPYGNQVEGAPVDGPGYTSHVGDPETSLIYMQARYYDPLMGRFLSADPVLPSEGNAFNFNRFAYGNNNPILNIDPDGTTCKRAGGTGEYTCKVDDNSEGEFTDKQIETTEKAYTSAVRELDKNPNKSVYVKVGGTTFRTTARDVVRGLASAVVKTAGANAQKRADTRGGGLSGVDANGRPIFNAQITIFANAVTSARDNSSGSLLKIERDLERTFAHEGIHTTGDDFHMYNEYIKAGPKRWGDVHRDGYNSAGDELLK